MPRPLPFFETRTDPLAGAEDQSGGGDRGCGCGGGGGSSGSRKKCIHFIRVCALVSFFFFSVTHLSLADLCVLSAPPRRRSVAI